MNDNTVALLLVLKKENILCSWSDLSCFIYSMLNYCIWKYIITFFLPNVLGILLYNKVFIREAGRLPFPTFYLQLLSYRVLLGERGECGLAKFFRCFLYHTWSCHLEEWVDPRYWQIHIFMNNRIDLCHTIHVLDSWLEANPSTSRMGVLGAKCGLWQDPFFWPSGKPEILQK